MNGGSIVFLLIMVAIFAVLISSQRRRQRAALQVQHQLEPGSQVMTTAGLFATVISVNDADVELEVAPGVVCRYARQAIARVVDPGPDGSHEALDGGQPDGTGFGADDGTDFGEDFGRDFGDEEPPDPSHPEGDGR